MNDPIKTADRLPTREDANAGGSVLIWDERHETWREWSWIDVRPTVSEFWQPQPAAPRSADDEAFEAIWTGGKPDGLGQREYARTFFDAGTAHARKEQK